MGTVFEFGGSGFTTSGVALGCMGLGGSWDSDDLPDSDVSLAEKAVMAAVESGIRFFDHADIYTRGKAEDAFGRVLERHPGLRETIHIQSKCGIRFPGDPRAGSPGRYDFSYEHIVKSVDGSLARLRCDYLDLLLLHRPDPLMRGEEVARAFDDLKRAGKVRYFGVSNFQPRQIDLLQGYVDDNLAVNQLEINLIHHGLVDSGVTFNQGVALDYHDTGGTLAHAEMHGIRVQAWRPLYQGYLSGRDPSEQPHTVRRTAEVVARIAGNHDTSREAVVLAWLMRLPVGIQPVVGTANPERIRACALAMQVELSREEWYLLYEAARGEAMP